MYKKDYLRESRVGDIQERHLGPEETAFVNMESSSSKPCSVKHCYALICFSVPRGKKMFRDQISLRFGIYCFTRFSTRGYSKYILVP